MPVLLKCGRFFLSRSGMTVMFNGSASGGQQSNQQIGCITETDIAEATAQGEDLNEIRIRDLVAHRHGFARLCKQVGRRLAENLAGRR